MEHSLAGSHGRERALWLELARVWAAAAERPELRRGALVQSRAVDGWI